MGPRIQISFDLNFHCSKRLFQDGYHGCSCSQHQRKKGKNWRYVCTFSLNFTANNKAIVSRSSRNRLSVKELLQSNAFCVACAERRFWKKIKILVNFCSEIKFSTPKLLPIHMKNGLTQARHVLQTLNIGKKGKKNRNSAWFCIYRVPISCLQGPSLQWHSRNCVQCTVHIGFSHLWVPI